MTSKTDKPAAETPILDQIRFAGAKENRVASIFCAAFCGFLPFATWWTVHQELHNTPDLHDIRTYLALGGLVFSAKTVMQWAGQIFRTRETKPDLVKAIGFTVLLEGVMTQSATPWLSIMALVYLCTINAIAGAVAVSGRRAVKATTAARNAKVVQAPRIALGSSLDALPAAPVARPAPRRRARSSQPVLTAVAEGGSTEN